MKQIGKHIKKLRMEQGMTQDQLAQALNVTRQAVSNWETGKTQPSIETLTAIARIAKEGMSVARAEKYIDTLLIQREETAHRTNVSTFLNTLNQTLQKIQLSGIAAVSERRETESQIVLTITIPK